MSFVNLTFQTRSVSNDMKEFKKILARDRFEAIAAAGWITCHRNEPSVEKAGYWDKYEIDDKLAGP